MTPFSIERAMQMPKRPQDTRVVVAMSGGVDSSVVAALLHEAGYDVVGLTMQLYDQGEMAVRKKACCAGQDIYDAKQVAQTIGFPHYVLDYESRFQNAVMDDFADSYLRGETPIPCVRCNQEVKFKDLLTMARDLGGECLVTGHYVQWVQGDAGAELHRAKDPLKDQSYFLFTTTPAQLSYLRFPLGGLTKEETRAHAARFGLDVADKPDSQDICFVPNGDYAQIVQRLRPGALEAGDIVDVDGTVLGQHEGIIQYTIGQRRGLGISSASGEPLYVLRLEPETHRVIVGPREMLACKRLVLREVNWLGDETTAVDRRLEVKYRSTTHPVTARLTLRGDGTADVVLETPEYGVSPGQACVFYDGERILGGGWIAAAPTAVEAVCA